jgi:1,2-diacylglycerol 3-beta-glucosyltransferase
MMFLGMVLAGLTFLLWLPNLLEICALARWAFGVRGKHSPELGSAPLPRLVFLVPAHNEELLVAHTVRSLLAMDYPSELRKVVVIADNCVDQTATQATAAGADCLERHVPELRGKQHALSWAFKQIDLTDVDGCVIIDADTVVSSGFARGLAAVGPLENIAVTVSTLTLNEWDTWMTRLTGLLARSRLDVTYRILEMGGLNVPLSGMTCLGRNLLLPNGWQAFSLTENWELYARYTAEGIRIRFAPEAKVYTQLPRTMQQGQAQRSRWLAGRTWVLRAWGGRIWRSRQASLLDKFATLVWLAGLSPVLQLVAAFCVALPSLFVPTPWGTWLAFAAISSTASQIVATTIALAKHPQPGATLSAFVRLPMYAAWRVSLAIATSLRSGTGEWQRTERHSVQ